MKGKKLLIWAAVALALFFVVSDPQAASDTVNGIFGGLGDAGDSATAFLNGLGG